MPQDFVKCFSRKASPPDLSSGSFLVPKACPPWRVALGICLAKSSTSNRRVSGRDAFPRRPSIAVPPRVQEKVGRLGKASLPESCPKQVSVQPLQVKEKPGPFVTVLTCTKRLAPKSRQSQIRNLGRCPRLVYEIGAAIRLAAPPPEPDRRISRIRLSKRWTDSALASVRRTPG